MKTLSVAAIFLAALGGSALALPSKAPAKPASAFACDVSALTDQIRFTRARGGSPRRAVRERPDPARVPGPSYASAFALLTE
jgi:hypothetical protein